MLDEVRVVVGGTIARDPEPCPQCGDPVLFCVDAQERVTHTLCGNHRCPLWLLEIEEADR